MSVSWALIFAVLMCTENVVTHKPYCNCLHACSLVGHVSTVSRSKYHKDECLSSPCACAVRLETNSDWQMGRGHPVNSCTGQGDIKCLSVALIKEGSSPTCAGSREIFIMQYCNFKNVFIMIFYQYIFSLLHNNSNIQIL